MNYLLAALVVIGFSVTIGIQIHMMKLFNENMDFISASVHDFDRRMMYFEDPIN